MNSVAAGAIMLGVVGDDAERKAVRGIARRNSIATLVAMLLTFLAGSYIFSILGISTHSLMVFGGVVLMMMGLHMVSGQTKRVNHSQDETAAAQEQDDISVVPLSIPVIVGPGLATTLITLSATSKNIEAYISVLVAIVIACFINYLVLANMTLVKRTIGIQGIKILTRVMGLVVGSIAAQMILEGAKALFA
ncbi:MAG TPA: hypothetical protein DDX92_01915 [Flavobacteriales bacterium]|nr:hypothetical protein [Flavobacteriales bacterium]